MAVTVGGAVAVAVAVAVTVTVAVVESFIGFGATILTSREIQSSTARGFFSSSL